MDVTKARIASLAISLMTAATFTGCVVSPVTGPTFWQQLGIPKMVPKVMPIAAEINLESPIPAIKKAAEVKKAEDLAKQKIKSVKYLAKIGCGCYNKDDSITDALLAALDDCTESVRYETVKAIAKNAKGDPCEYCNDSKCCSDVLMNRLSQIAYDLNDAGCPLEPSERVREMAVEALSNCCPCQMCAEESTETPPMPEQTPEPKKEEGKEVPQPPKPAPPAADNKSASATEDFEATIANAFSEEQSEAEETAEEAADEQTEAAAEGIPAELQPEPEAQQVAAVSEVAEASQQTESIKPASRTDAQVATGPMPERGVVRHVDMQTGTAVVDFDRNGKLAAGSQLLVYHRYALGRISSVGELEVVESVPGSASVRPVGSTKITRVATGDQILVIRGN